MNNVPNFSNPDDANSRRFFPFGTFSTATIKPPFSSGKQRVMKLVSSFLKGNALALLVVTAFASCSEKDEENPPEVNQQDLTPDEIAQVPGDEPTSGVKQPKIVEATPDPDPADDGWLGEDADGGGDSATLASGPKPVAKTVSLRGATQAVKDIKVTGVKLSGDSPVASMKWSPDGKHLFLLNEDGVLRKVAYPSLEQELVLDTGGTGGGMELSQLGILIGVPSLGQIWLVDGRSLAVKKKIPAANPAVSGFTTSLRSTVVYVSDDHGQKLIMIDLKTGEPVKEFTANALQEKYGKTIKKHPDGVVLSNLSLPTMTPDGKYLFCEGFECMHRLKVSGTDLVYEEMSARLGSPNRLFVDRDSRYVGMGGLVYPVSDLGKAVIKLNDVTCLDLDQVSKNIYTGDWDQQLIIYTSKGLKRQGYEITDRSDDFRQILAHPDGGMVLVQTESELFHVELSADASQPEKEVAPEEKRVALRGQSRKVDALNVTEVKLPGESVLGCMQWSPDGKHLYVLSNDGVLRKISYPTLEQELVLETGGAVGWLQWSKLGLLVGIEGIGQIWVVDGTTLAVKKRIGAARTGEFSFTSSLQSSAVYVSDDDSQRLIMIDLETGEPVKEFSARDLDEKYRAKIKKHPDSVALSDLRFPTLTPDGKHLFCEGFECLHRFKVSGNDLIYEEMGPRIGSNVQRIFVDPSSQYVAMPAGGGNERPSGHPEAGSYVTYVYKVSDLGRPVITLAGGAYPGCIGLDKASKNVYLENHDYQLIIFTAKGKKVGEYVLTKDSNDVRQILVHPTGGKLFVLTESALLHVER